MARSRPAIEPDAIYSRKTPPACWVSLSTSRSSSTRTPPGEQAARDRRIFIKGASILAMLEATIVEKA
jgi:hypothetical protein